MDVADDIAYSTYDLEDSLKAGFLTPAGILASNDLLLSRVATKVSEAVGRKISSKNVLETFADIFSDLTQVDEPDDPMLLKLVLGYRSSENLGQSGFLRTALSSQLVHEAINSAQIKYNRKFPMLSEVKLSEQSRLKVEVLEHYTFEATVYSARGKLTEFRGYEVVSSIFKALSSKRGELLLPEDIREQLRGKSKAVRMRAICDFVAGMTDRYAVEFYGRLHSDGAQSMFKPITISLAPITVVTGSN